MRQWQFWKNEENEIMETTVIIQKSLSTPRVRSTRQGWHGQAGALAYDEELVRQTLLGLDDEVYVVRSGEQVGITSAGEIATRRAGELDAADLLAVLPPLPAENLGD